MAMDQTKAVCKEKQRLLEKYELVTASYAAALAELRQGASVLSKEGFDKALYHLTEIMLQDVAAARISLQSHIRKHCC